MKICIIYDFWTDDPADAIARNNREEIEINTENLALCIIPRAGEHIRIGDRSGYVRPPSYEYFPYLRDLEADPYDLQIYINVAQQP